MKSAIYCPSREALTTATVRFRAPAGNSTAKNMSRLCQVTDTAPFAFSI